MNYASRNEKTAPAISLAEEADFSLGPLRVLPSARQTSFGERMEMLEPRVMQVLVVLARADGAVVSREHLIVRCWEGRIVGEAAINRCISILREIAETSAAFTIETIPRVGYRLIASTPMTKPEVDVDRPAIVTPPDSSHRKTSPYLWIAVAVVLLTAVTLVAYGVRFYHGAQPEPSASPAQASIAVLPFKNLSSDKDAGYLAEGVQDEILTRLAKIGALKVISRTSTEEFANHAPNLRNIATKLGVANVLEGNVQKSGNRIRINVQLIRAATDTHLWAEDYDRSLDDVLSVESDVAGAIAEVLAAKMSPHEREEIAAKPTDNAQAYNLYLRALVFANKNDSTSLQTVTQLLMEATRLDPKFALAWSLLARNEAYRHFGDDLPTVRKGAAHAALAKALSLQPALAEAQVAKGFYLYYGEMNYPAAERELRVVNARWPNNAEAMEALALILRRLGKWKESTIVLEELVHLDPLSEHHRVLLAGAYEVQHEFGRSLATLDNALQIWPTDGELLAMKASVFQDLGKLDAAAAVLRNVHPAPDDDNVLGAVMNQFWMQRQYAKGAEYFRGLLAVEQGGEDRESVALTLRMLIGEYLRMENDVTGARENYSAALVSIQKELKAQPESNDLLVALSIVYAGLGDGAKALALLAKTIRAMRSSNNALDLIGAETVYAHLIARIGDRPAAIAEIAHVLKPPSGLTAADLRFEPDFDSLRGDPRFEVLAHSDAATPD